MNTFCEHKYVTEIQKEGFEHPIKCDDCDEIIECEHEYELSEDDRLYCWVCGFEPDLADWVKED